jgi:hypothetical protein
VQLIRVPYKIDIGPQFAPIFLLLFIAFNLLLMLLIKKNYLILFLFLKKIVVNFFERKMFSIIKRKLFSSFFF